MKMFKILLLLMAWIICYEVHAKDYHASLFGIKSDGTTLNTRSIQFAIDYIHKQGGGRLVFYVGRYLTGSIHLKSNVMLYLEEGAILVGSINPFDYDKDGFSGLVMANGANNMANGANNIGLTGKGVIEGQGRELGNNYTRNVHLGLVNDPLKYDRAAERAKLVYFRNCLNVLIKQVTFTNSSFWVQTYDQCKNLLVDSITVRSTAYWNNDGIDIVDCDSAIISNNYVDTSDDGICLKSHKKVGCNNVLVKNNVVRSSANGIKFGTYGVGGFRNISIVNNTIYNTYRSAIALESVYGGVMDSVLVDGLTSINTGNVIFIRLGARSVKEGSVLRNIIIRNVVADVPLHKADAGYEYEGPVEDMPRNVSPIVISGLPDQYIENVTLDNLRISYPGSSSKFYANIRLDELHKIPEYPDSYPDFSMFGELPAWALFARHVKNLHLRNIHFSVRANEFRIPVVLDDVHTVRFDSLVVKPKTRKLYFANESTDIQLK